MNAKVRWKKRMSFIGRADSGFELPLGTKPEVGGDNDGFLPMELFLIGLAGCTAMDVMSILTKQKQEITEFEVLVNAERAESHPKVFTKSIIEYVIAGKDISEKAVDTAVRLSAEKYCPAQAMLGQVMQIELKITIK